LYFLVLLCMYLILLQINIYKKILHTYALRYSLLLLGYQSVQHVTVLNAVGQGSSTFQIVRATLTKFNDARGPQSYT
jgi:hypothetical protein